MSKKNLRKSQKIVGGLLGSFVLLAVLPANAYPRSGITERISVASNGAEANASSSSAPAISADGRYVAFSSAASNLVLGDTNEASDVFVSDRKAGTIERVSVTSDGAEANASSSSPAISADGRYVAFPSSASNLVPGDTNGMGDVFVHDRATGVTERISVPFDGTQADRSSSSPAISADGRYIAFSSAASNLVPGDTNETPDVFVRDRAAETTERASVASDGAEANARSSYPGISADGRYIAFLSLASNLVPGDTPVVDEGDTNGAADVFVRDRVSGATERVSVSSDGTQGSAQISPSQPPAISADGRYVAFSSSSFNLIPGDTNGIVPDVLVHDRVTGATERVSVDSDGAETKVSSSDYPAISADGRYVAFSSRATNLVPGDSNGVGDVFVHDRVTGATERVSADSDGAQGNGASDYPAISADGRYVAFSSAASNLVPGDTNGASDVFGHDRGSPLGVVGTPSVLMVPGEDRVSVSGLATFSGAVTSVTDPPDDGIPGAGPAGAELTGASLTYRPEQEDLLVRLRLASIPSLVNGAGIPAVLYGLRLTLEGARYEVRALRGVITNGSAPPSLSLYRCDLVCTEQAALTGGIGTTGTSVSVSVPLSALGAQEGSALTEIVAFAGLGDGAPGALVMLDQADLPATTIPARSVTLGIAPTGTPEAQVAFDTQAEIAGGSFSGTLDVGSFSPGDFEVWVRACLGSWCEARVAG